jgi:DNA mismatch repair protein MutS2
VAGLADDAGVAQTSRPVTATASKTLADLGWNQLVQHWVDRCAIARGVAAVRAMPFFDVPDEARTRIAEVSEARHLGALGAPVPLGGIENVSEAIARVRKAAALDAPELLAVARSGAALSRLRQHLKGHADEAERLATRAAAIADLGHVFHPILEAFDPDGRLVDHASEALGPLRRTLASIKVTLERRMEGLVRDERFAPWLQDTFYTQRDERYVLPVRTDGKGFVDGIVHGTSQSGQTLFIEPTEIVELNNRLKLAECDVADEERRILARFSGWVAEEADAFDAALEAAETLDVIAATARLADDLVAAAPVVDDAPRVALLFARHPLMLLAGRRCVANDITVPAGGSLLISGPNAGGKTVALKTTGLCALMTRLGMHLPAESGSIMGWFGDVRTDIGDAQSLEQNLSTFTGHVTELREYLTSAGPGTLLLVDEIAVGTDPEQGAALAQAVLEALAERGVTSIITTHYERLKALGASDARFANASVGFDLQRLEPTFKLHLGTPGSSGALTVAAKMGLPPSVIERARELQGQVGVRVEDLLASVAEQRRRLEEERALMIDELEKLEADRQAFRIERERRMARLDKEQAKAHGDALAQLKQARRELDQLRADLRRKAAAEVAPTADELALTKRRLAAVSSDIARHEPKHNLPPGRPATEADLVPGAPVIVPSVGGRGVVASAPERGRVEVRLGVMKTTVDIGDVLVDSHRAARKARGDDKPVETRADGGRDAGRDGGRNGGRPADGAPAAAVQLVDASGPRSGARTVEATLDVRGQRADEAVTAVERFLDEGMTAQRDVLFVIHGHGTGALRTAIRNHLARHPAVSRWRAGESSEGGDGVTVLWLKD